MPEALLCIKTNLNSDKEVLQELNVFEEVKEAFMVIGEYDIIAKVESKTFDDLVHLDQRIKGLANVREILSMLLIKSKKSVQEQENGVIVL
jgi:DNA-binding Lrp family transcriptional regulator